MPNWTESLFGREIPVDVGGGKAANTARLAQARFRIPLGFVVTMDAYHHFAANNRLYAILDAIWPRLQDNIQIYEAASHQIREIFSRAPMPAEIRQEILTRRRALGADMSLAVRSSSTIEDVEAGSLAGQQESYFNITGDQALIAGVQRCWSSLWTSRSIAYLHRNGIQPRSLGMGVLVQQMVPAIIAGVMFTQDPITNNPNRVLINATWGLGQAVAQGRMIPDVYVADKASGDLISSRVADKESQVVLKEGEMQEVPVPLDKRRHLCLQEVHVSALVKAGQQLEALFGQPQDVEWGLLSGNLYIFQSRPVRSIGVPPISLPPESDDDWLPLPAPQPGDLWSRIHLGDYWPGPLTPLTASLWQPIHDSVLSALLPINERGSQGGPAWIRRMHGRLYLNEGILARHLGVDPFAPFSSNSPALSDEEDSPQGVLYRPGYLLIQGLQSLRNDRALESSINTLKSALPRMAQMAPWEAPAPMSDAQIWSQLQRDLAEMVEIYQGQMAAELQIRLLSQELRQTVQERSLNELTFGVLPFAYYQEMEREFSQLAEQMGQSEAGSQLLARRAQNPNQPLWPALAEKPQAAPLLQKIEAFLERHGHHTGSERAQSRRAGQEFEWFHPRWAEAPEGLLGDLLRVAEQGNHNHLDRIISPGSWEKVTQEGQAKLNLLQRIGFNRNVNQLKETLALGEQGRLYLLRLLLPIRQGIGLLAARWLEQGLLQRVDDIFFLLAEEAAQLAEGRASGRDAQLQAHLAQRIQARRAAWQFWQEHPGSPDVMDWEFNSIESLGYQGLQMRGIGTSPGWAEGRARIIVSPREFGAIQPGEILVTHSCDPDWTPIFPLVKGVVAEVGGQLSHSSIAAREMGLPAVMGVTGALYRIHTGQSIRLDGSTGRVYLG